MLDTNLTEIAALTETMPPVITALIVPSYRTQKFLLAMLYEGLHLSHLEFEQASQLVTEHVQVLLLNSEEVEQL